MEVNKAPRPLVCRRGDLGTGLDELALAEDGMTDIKIDGTWPADDLRRAFVAGAQWWEWHKEGATMWPSDTDLAEAEAEKRYPGGKVKS